MWSPPEKSHIIPICCALIVKGVKICSQSVLAWTLTEGIIIVQIAQKPDPTCEQALCNADDFL